MALTKVIGDGVGTFASATITSATISNQLTTSNLPTGSVLQVVTAHYTAIESTSSTSLVASSVLANITPTLATSKILVDMKIQGILATAATSNIELALYNGTEGGSYSSLLTWNQGSGYTNASDERIYEATAAFNFLHDVNNTNNNRYTVYFCVKGSGTVYYNNYSNTNTSTASSITLMEIAA